MKKICSDIRSHIYSRIMLWLRIDLGTLHLSRGAPFGHIDTTKGAPHGKRSVPKSPFSGSHTTISLGNQISRMIYTMINNAAVSTSAQRYFCRLILYSKRTASARNGAVQKRG